MNFSVSRLILGSLFASLTLSSSVLADQSTAQIQMDTSGRLSQSKASMITIVTKKSYVTEYYSTTCSETDSEGHVVYKPCTQSYQKLVETPLYPQQTDVEIVNVTSSGLAAPTQISFTLDTDGNLGIVSDSTTDILSVAKVGESSVLSSGAKVVSVQYAVSTYPVSHFQNLLETKVQNLKRTSNALKFQLGNLQGGDFFVEALVSRTPFGRCGSSARPGPDAGKLAKYVVSQVGDLTEVRLPYSAFASKRIPKNPCISVYVSLASMGDGGFIISPESRNKVRVGRTVKFK
jgi:hypothetical protein